MFSICCIQGIQLGYKLRGWSILEELRNVLCGGVFVLSADKSVKKKNLYFCKRKLKY